MTAPAPATRKAFCERLSLRTIFDQVFKNDVALFGSGDIGWIQRALLHHVGALGAPSPRMDAPNRGSVKPDEETGLSSEVHTNSETFFDASPDRVRRRALHVGPRRCVTGKWHQMAPDGLVSGQ